MVSEGNHRGKREINWEEVDRALGFPSGASGKELTCQCRRCERHRFNPQVGKIPWKKAWQPTPLFLPGEYPQLEEPSRLQSMGTKGRIRLSD